MTSVRLTLADSAVDMLTQSMAFRFTSVQLTLADGAVDVLTQSMTFRFTSAACSHDIHILLVVMCLF